MEVTKLMADRGVPIIVQLGQVVLLVRHHADHLDAVLLEERFDQGVERPRIRELQDCDFQDPVTDKMHEDLQGLPFCLRFLPVECQDDDPLDQEQAAGLLV